MEQKVVCPFCGCATSVTFDSESECKGIYVRCKARHCKKVFEIKVKKGNQIRDVK